MSRIYEDKKQKIKGHEKGKRRTEKKPSSYFMTPSGIDYT